MKKGNLGKIISTSISILIFGWCLRYLAINFQWSEIFEVLWEANLSWLILGGISTLIIFSIFRSLRWYYLLRISQIHIPLQILHTCNTAVMFLTIVTPFQSGELLKIELLKKRGLINRSFGYSSFLIERVMDLFIVTSLAAISVITGLNEYQGNYILYAYLFFCICLAAIIIYILKVKPSTSISLILYIQGIFGSLPQLTVTLILSMAAWIMVALSWQVCLYSINIAIDFYQAIALMSGITILNILSFIPGGYGISEVGIAHYLTLIGVEPISAQAGAIIIRIQSVLLILVSLLHLIAWNFSQDKQQ